MPRCCVPMPRSTRRLRSGSMPAACNGRARPWLATTACCRPLPVASTPHRASPQRALTRRCHCTPWRRPCRPPCCCSTATWAMACAWRCRPPPRRLRGRRCTRASCCWCRKTPPAGCCRPPACRPPQRWMPCTRRRALGRPGRAAGHRPHPLPAVGAHRPGGAPVSARQRQRARPSCGARAAARRATGSWRLQLPARLSGQFYRYLVDVWVPGTGLVRQRVTDPYALGLGTDSQHTWIGSLDDPATQPAGWAGAPRPRRPQRQHRPVHL